MMDIPQIHSIYRFKRATLGLMLGCVMTLQAEESPSTHGLDEFTGKIKPFLNQYCSDCHADGAKKGGLALDEWANDQAALDDKVTWYKVLRNMRAEFMPPAHKDQPKEEERKILDQWIKSSVFKANPKMPDPGRVTVRRLNRVEYRNTIRELTDIEFDVAEHFPPDDTGHGFDNIGDVLTLPPMLLEKYLSAASDIAAKAVPDDANTPESRKFFPRPDPPREQEAEREAYARELLKDFGTRAYRRPIDDASLEKLLSMAKKTWRTPNSTFEDGITQAVTAILASPRFIFREEFAEPLPPDAPPGTAPLLDEYSLASRLSYFFWSAPPDAELLKLAGEKKLREQYEAQVQRLKKDRRARSLVRNFAGQWLLARDIESIALEERSILAREESPDPEMEKMRERSRELRNKPDQFLTPEEREEQTKIREFFRNRFGKGPRIEVTGAIRRAMRQETELTVQHVIDEDLPLTQLIDSDWTFLNERLAKYYGIPGVEGDDMRLVKLPADNPRGGVLTQGTVLASTSNPTRTSPVKRGIFILENVLGAPAAPPPANVPPLEDAAGERGRNRFRPLPVRELLAKHREQPLCASCHDRMDPLGLALENFSAMGLWREMDAGEKVDPTGKLHTGDSFANVKELKQLLATRHSKNYYFTITSKMLTYALGRGLDWRDIETVDKIVADLEASGGKPSTLINGILHSAAFLRRGTEGPVDVGH